MKSILFAVGGIFFYAAAGVLMERKLSGFHTSTLMCVYGLVISLGGIALRQTLYKENAGFDFPIDQTLFLFLVLGLVYVAADYCYVSAYTSGGTAVTVTTVAMLAPVFAAIIVLAIDRKLPTLWDLATFVSALVTLLLAFKGSGLSK